MVALAKNRKYHKEEISLTRSISNSCSSIIFVLGFRVQGVEAWSQRICACAACESFISHLLPPQDRSKPKLTRIHSTTPVSDKNESVCFVTTRSQHYPYLAGQCLKKLVKMTFSTSRPKSSGILSDIKLFLKIMNVSGNHLYHKKIYDAFTQPKFMNCDKKYVSYKKYLNFEAILREVYASQHFILHQIP